MKVRLFERWTKINDSSSKFCNDRSHTALVDERRSARRNWLSQWVENYHRDLSTASNPTIRAGMRYAKAWHSGIVILAERPGRATVSESAASRVASEIRVASKCQSISIGHGDSDGNRRERKYVLLPDLRVGVARVPASIKAVVGAIHGYYSAYAENETFELSQRRVFKIPYIFKLYWRIFSTNNKDIGAARDGLFNILPLSVRLLMVSRYNDAVEKCSKSFSPR